MSALRRSKAADSTVDSKKPAKVNDPISQRVLLKPHLSEKSYGLSEERNTYVFVVPPSANRLIVAKAVAGQYQVTVESVRIAAQPPKNQRTYRRRGRIVYTGQTAGSRKAYVRLKEGDKLPIFAAVEEAKTAEEAKTKGGK